MARESRLQKAQREWQPGVPQRPRSVRVMFASTVLSLEALLMFFYGLMSWGLYQHEWFAWWLFGGSLVVSVLLVVTCGLLSKPFGYAMGWALQCVIIAGGVFEPFMYFVGVAFLCCWAYAVIKGRQLDIEKQARFEAELEFDRHHAEESES